MENSSEKSISSLRDRLKRIAAMAGMSLLGPVFLFVTLSWFINGEVPGSRGRGGIDAVDHPLLFYFLIALFGAVSLVLTYASIMFVIGYIHNRRLK